MSGLESSETTSGIAWESLPVLVEMSREASELRLSFSEKRKLLYVTIMKIE